MLGADDVARRAGQDREQVAAVGLAADRPVRDAARRRRAPDSSRGRSPIAVVARARGSLTASTAVTAPAGPARARPTPGGAGRGGRRRAPGPRHGRHPRRGAPAPARRSRRSTPHAQIVSTSRSLPPSAKSPPRSRTARGWRCSSAAAGTTWCAAARSRARRSGRSDSTQTCSGTSSRSGPRISRAARGVLGRHEVGVRAVGALARRARASSGRARRAAAAAGSPAGTAR